jgi:glycosyltransferase involved in cell wall biosynthesis
MPPRIAYWTSSFEPHMEAVASEVALLRQHFKPSIAWGLSHRHWLFCSRQRGFCVHPRLSGVFRGLTWLVGAAFQLNHIVGSVGDWFYLRGTRSPTVLTLATQNPPVELALLRRIDRFVVEYPGGRDTLLQLGIEPRQIQLIFPPVDLERFHPTPAPNEPFTVLFASSPDVDDWLDARGVPQLLDAARLRPQMRFRLLWRPWGNSLEPVRRLIVQRRLENVEVVVGAHTDMPGQYRQAHVTVAPFTDANRAKPAPNSIIESLACGRPVLVSPMVGLANLIAEERAGLVSSVTGEALAEHLDRLAADWESYSLRARRTAEHWFSADNFVASYARLYEKLLRRQHF